MSKNYDDITAGRILTESLPFRVLDLLILGSGVFRLIFLSFMGLELSGKDN